MQIPIPLLIEQFRSAWDTAAGLAPDAGHSAYDQDAECSYFAPADEAQAYAVFTNGECQTFALALQAFLGAGDMRVCESENCFEHFALRVADTTYDVFGAGAEGRWSKQMAPYMGENPTWRDMPEMERLLVEGYLDPEVLAQSNAVFKRLSRSIEAPVLVKAQESSATAKVSSTLAPTRQRMISLIDGFRDSWTGAGDPWETAKPQFGTEPIGDIQTNFEFMNGRCHDFALGLASYLRTKGVDSTLLVQTTKDAKDELARYAHAVLKVGKETYDINGASARDFADKERKHENAGNARGTGNSRRDGPEGQVGQVGQSVEWIEMPAERRQFKSILPFLANGPGTACYASVANKVCAHLKAVEKALVRSERASSPVKSLGGR